MIAAVRESCLSACLVGLSLLSMLAIGCEIDVSDDDPTAEPIVTATAIHTGTMDGEPLTFVVMASLAEASVDEPKAQIVGEYSFPVIGAFEGPFVQTWIIVKKASVEWVIEHFIRDLAFEDLVMDVGIESDVTFSTGHTMTATHKFEGSRAVFTETTSFEVQSPGEPAEPPELPDMFASTARSMHWPGGPGVFHITTVYSVEDVEIARSTSTVTLNANPTWILPEVFETTGTATISGDESGTSGTFRCEAIERRVPSCCPEFECTGDLCFCEGDDDCNDMFGSGVCGDSPFPDAVCDTGPPVTCVCSRAQAREACSSDSECDDQNACTVDSCDSSDGCLHVDVVCEDDGDLCTIEACTTTSGCVSTPLLCLVGESCVEGECVPVEP